MAWGNEVYLTHSVHVAFSSSFPRTSKSGHQSCHWVAILVALTLLQERKKSLDYLFGLSFWWALRHQDSCLWAAVTPVRLDNTDPSGWGSPSPARPHPAVLVTLARLRFWYRNTGEGAPQSKTAAAHPPHAQLTRHTWVSWWNYKLGKNDCLLKRVKVRSFSKRECLRGQGGSWVLSKSREPKSHLRPWPRHELPTPCTPTRTVANLSLENICWWK